MVQRAVAASELEKRRELPLIIAEDAVTRAQAEFGQAEARHKAALEELRVTREARQEALEKLHSLEERRNELRATQALGKKLTA